MKLLFLIILLISNLYSLNIKERNTNSIKITYDNTKEKTCKIYESKNGKDFDNTFNEIKINNEIKGLNPKTLYKVKTETNEKIFWTLAEEPKKPGTNITFLKANSNSIKIKVDYNGCEGALLLVTLDNKLEKPIDGQEYKKKVNIDGKPVIGNTYVLGKVKNKEIINLENLKHEIYKFTLIPFNGENETVNYNTLKNIERETHPQLPIPILKECDFFKENVAEIKWEKVEGVKYYEVTVCEDINCNEKVLEYDQADLGNGTKFSIYLDDEQKKYYWKLKAVGLYNSSEYSEVMEIDFNFINGAKK